MASNIPHHDQKNRIFAKRERALIHAIKNGFSSAKIAAAAERLREAKIAVFKCRFALYTLREPHTFSAEEMALSDKQVHKWLSMLTSDIVKMYRTHALGQVHEFAPAVITFEPIFVNPPSLNPDGPISRVVIAQ